MHYKCESNLSQQSPASPAHIAISYGEKSRFALPIGVTIPPVFLSTVLICIRDSSGNLADIELLQVRGIGEKRVKQLKEIGINTANDLVKESPEKIAKKLKISPKITRKWNDSAKKLLK